MLFWVANKYLGNLTDNESKPTGDLMKKLVSILAICFAAQTIASSLDELAGTYLNQNPNQHGLCQDLKSVEIVVNSDSEVTITVETASRTRETTIDKINQDFWLDNSGSFFPGSGVEVRHIWNGQSLLKERRPFLKVLGLFKKYSDSSEEIFVKKVSSSKIEFKSALTCELEK